MHAHNTGCAAQFMTTGPHVPCTVVSAQSEGMLLQDNEQVVELDVSDNSLHDTSGAALARLLQSNTQLTSLDLAENTIAGKACPAFSTLLSSSGCNLCKLSLRHCGLGDKDALALSPGLSSNKSLTLLDLQHNSIGECGAVALGNALGENRGLVELNLSWNPLRPKGGAAVAKGASAHSHLQVLDVARCGLQDAGVAAFGPFCQASQVPPKLSTALSVTAGGQNWATTACLHPASCSDCNHHAIAFLPGSA